VHRFLAAAALFLFAAPLSAQEERRRTALTPEESAAGWILLFDGVSLDGWRAEANSRWTVLDGFLAPQAGAKGLLVTTRRFRSYELVLEYTTTLGSDAALLVGCDARGANRTQSMPLRLNRRGWAVQTFRVESGQIVHERFRMIGDVERTGSSGVVIEKQRREPRHLALSGNGLVIRSLKLRPLPDADARWWQ
jgi:hypothetical protein